MKPTKLTKINKYQLTHEDIANMFGYSNAKSLDNSSAKDRILQGVDSLILYIEEQMIKKLKE